MLNESWVDQYKRLQRSHALLQRVADQNNHDPELQEPDNARDTLYHFCCDAFHLKDWILKSTGVDQQTKDALREFFKKNTGAPPSPALAACADIANASKHLGLDSSFGSYTAGGPAEITEQTQGAKFPMTFPFHFAANHWKVMVDGQERDALELAAEAVADWNQWLTARGLLPLP